MQGTGAGAGGPSVMGLFTGPARCRDEGEPSAKRGAAAELQAELAKVNAAFVSAVCDHRETKAALVAKVKVLEGDLHTAKQTCKDQEYHMQQEKAREKAEKGAETGAEKEQELEKARAAWAQENAGLEKENAGLRKRVRELEVVELGWQQVRGIFTTERMCRGGI